MNVNIIQEITRNLATFFLQQIQQFSLYHWKLNLESNCHCLVFSKFEGILLITHSTVIYESKLHKYKKVENNTKTTTKFIKQTILEVQEDGNVGGQEINHLLTILRAFDSVQNTFHNNMWIKNQLSLQKEVHMCSFTWMIVFL